MHDLFLTVLGHGAAGPWDEIIPLAMAGLSTAAGVAVFLISRRFRAESDEVDEPDAPE